MRIVRTVVVLDAADIATESAFWAGMFDGHVYRDDNFHSVIDASGQWRLGIQLAPDHTPPQWPDGAPQQVHLDLHVEDPDVAHEHATALGATVLWASEPGSAHGHRVYADPAGHPFCIGWGHPSPSQLAEFVRDQFGIDGDPR